MNNEFQSVDFAKLILESRLRKGTLSGEKPSPSGLFGTVRKHPRLSLIGDYPLLCEVIAFVKEQISTSQFRTMMNRSEEYKGLPKKEKMQWKESLLSRTTQEKKEVRLIKNEKRLKIKKRIGGTV